MTRLAVRAGAVLLAANAMLLGASPASALLEDPSFEAASPGTATSQSAWELLVNMPDGVQEAAVFQEASFAASDGDIGVWFRSFEGGQSQGDPPADALLTQTLAAVAGGDYALTFEASREEHFTAAVWRATLSSSGTGGSDSVDLLGPVFTETGNMLGTPTLFALQLSGVSPGDDLTVTVEMQDGVLAPINPQSAFVDDFNLTRRVPEPGIAWLLGPGLAGVAWRRRRR